MPSENDLRAVIRQYEDSLKHGGSVYFDADQFAQLADFYDATGDVSKAFVALNKALTIHPHNEILLVKKAKCLIFFDKHEEALQLLSQLSVTYDFDVFMAKAECYVQLEKYSEAIHLFNIVLEEEDVDDMGDTLIEISTLFYNAELYYEALLYYEKSKEYITPDLETQSDMAYAYEMIGDLESAIMCHNKVLDEDPYEYESWKSLGRLYALLDNQPKAIEAFDFALAIEEDDTDILKLKATSLLLGGRALEASEIFSKLIDESPGDSALYLLIGQCYGDLGLYAEAIDVLVKYEKEVGEDIDLFISYCNLHLKMGNVEGALAVAQRAIEEQGEKAELLVLRGEVYQIQGDEAKALDDHIKALSLLDADNIDLLDKIAVGYIKLGDLESAVNYTKEILKRNQSSVFMKKRLALLYFEINDEESFNLILDDLDRDDLVELLGFFYSSIFVKGRSKAEIITMLNEAREQRSLYKNLKY